MIVLTMIISGLSMPHLDDIHKSPHSSSLDNPLLIPESVSGVVSSGQELGIVSLNMKLNVMVTLPYRNQSELSSLLHSLQDRNSPLYHKFLSAYQFENMFSPSSKEYSQYVSYFKNQGLLVTVYPDKVSIGLTGTVRQFDRLFNSTLMNFHSSSGNYFAPSRQLSLTVDYGNLSSVVGLNNKFKPTISPMFTGSNTSQVLYGGDMQNLYQLTKLYEQYGYPTNETIATILWSGTDSSGTSVAPYVPSDISYYFSHNIPSNEPKPVVYGYPILGAPPPGSSASTDQSSAHLESTLDLEMAGSTAPGAKIVEVYGPSATLSDADQAFAAILNPNYNSTVDSALSKVVAISNSWGTSDTNDTTWMQYEEEAAARGITVLASSGDSGNSNGAAPSYPASMSYDSFGTLAVGGTETLLSGTSSPNGTGTTGVQTQSVWYGSPSSTDGTQGGVSSVFQEPSWQVNSGDANSVISDYAGLNGVSSGRGTPDISAVGANMSIYVTSGSTAGYTTVWGTSIASPIIAGLIATVDNSLGSPEGFVNSILYNLGESQYQGSLLKPTPFYFIYNGSNALYPALHGYSLAVGWGSINAYNFVQDQLTVQIPYAVTFKESGLPSGAEWYINTSIGNRSGPIASGSNYTLQLDNGTYSYSAAMNNNSFSAPAGIVRVNGSNVIVDVSFVEVYQVYFSEKGLPVNTPWYLLITGGKTFGPILSSNYSVYLENGTYSFTVSAPTGYVSSPYVSTFQVKGAPVILEQISFVQDNFPSELVRSSLAFNMTEYLSEIVSVSSTNPAEVNFASNSTSFIVNGTSNQPESFGNYTINVQKIEQMLNSNEIPQSTAVLSFALAGGTSFSYGGVNTLETFSAGGENLLTVSTYLSSSESTLDFNGTVFRENYPLPTLRLDFSTLGKITISSSYSSGINGAYSYSQTYPIDFNYLYFNSTDNGFSFITNQYHGWSITTSPMKMITYPVTFQETGLPYSAFWYVNLSDGLKSSPIGTGSNYTIYLSNGTYNFTATNTFSSYGAYGRDFTVNGEPIAQLTISFSNYTYPAIFEEKGLPTGTVWYVNLTPTSFSGPIPAGSNYSVELPNGTHLFTPSTSNPMYGSLIEYGNITVTGSATTMVISFTNKYNVTFKEEGLQNGIYWYVKISNGARVEELSGNSIVFQLFNGSYSYLVGDDSNYLVTPFSGSFLVKGADVFVETVSFLPLIPTTEWINSSLRFNITKYISESIHVTPTNPADVQFENNFTKFQVNGTSNVPESYGNYKINITYIDQLLINHEIQGNNANFSLTLAGGTSYSYGGVYTNNTITVGSQKLLDIETYLSSLQSTLDFNGTVFTNNYALPRIYFNFSTQGMVTIYSASSNLNGNYYYHHVFNITSTILYFNTTDYSFSPQGYGNKYQGWSVQVNPLPLLTYPVKITENGLPANAFWFFNLTYGKTSGPIPSSSTYTTYLLNGTYSYITGSTNSLYSTPNKAFSVNGASVSLSLFFAENFSVNFSEDGLPPGAIWYVNISSGQDSGPILAGSNYSVNLYNGTYAYTLSTSYPTYGPVIPGGTLYIRGSQLSETVTFGALFEDTISETGLPQGTIWYVNLSNGVVSGAIAGSSFTFFLTNGSYSYTVATSNKIYSPSPYLGSFQVNDSPASESISFHQVMYTVTFTKSNLLAGTAWYVNITESNGTLYNSGAITSSSFSFTLTNGSYSYTIATSDKIYDPSPLYGSFTVNGSSLSKSITFSEVLYTVTITETGLPSEKSWYMNVTETNGTIYRSGVISTSSYSFSLTNGSYSYMIASANKIFAPSPISSTFSVDGGPATFSITFSAVKYAVTFQETGLPSGTPWYVNVTESNGTLYNSGAITSSSFSFTLTNGSYSFTIASANKTYAPNLTAGSFAVNGLSLSESITFSEVLYSVQFTESGLPSGTSWYVNISGMTSSGPITTNTYSIKLTNGTYIFAISTFNKIYAPYYTDTLTVNGGNQNISIVFKPVVYNITFNSVNLPSGYIWYVNLSNRLSSGPISGSRYSFSLTNGSYTYTIASANKIYAPTLISATFTVDGSTIAIPTTFTLVKYNLTIQESGLPTNTEWNLTFEDTTYQLTNSSYTFSIPNGTYSFFAISHDYKDVSGTITVNGSSFSYTIKMELQLYETTFNQTGLQSGMFWYVNISGMASSGPIGSGTNYTVNLTNCTYVYSISTSNRIYAPVSSQNSLIVNGSSLKIVIKIIEVTYNIEFKETGLPLGISWYVNITESNGTAYLSGPITGSTYTFSLTNGSYTYTIASANRIYSPSIISSSLTVNGNPYTESIAFSLVKYTVTFTESGLLFGTGWYVNLTNGIDSGPITGSSYSFSLVNGSYSYTVQTVNKIYSPASSSGSFTVNGTPLSKSIVFSMVTYGLTFKETGLPLGVIWYVNGSGLSGYETSPADISFNLSNGTYSFTVTNLSNYYSTATHFSVVISGKNVTEVVDYYHWAYITGAISPTNANLVINGKSVSLLSSGSFNISVPVGTYHVVISSSGYVSYYSNFTLNSGNAMNLTINLKQVSHPSTLTGIDLYIVVGTVIAVIAIGAAVVLIKRRK
jgi:hypothetical protein